MKALSIITAARLADREGSYIPGAVSYTHLFAFVKCKIRVFDKWVPASGGAAHGFCKCKVLCMVVHLQNFELTAAAYHGILVFSKGGYLNYGCAD